MKNASDGFFEDIDSDTLESAAKLFIYLNTCSAYVTDWADFYIDLISSQPLDQIILTINRLIKTTNYKPQRQKIAHSIFNYIRNLTKLDDIK